MSRIPSFIVQEHRDNEIYIIVENDGVKMILLNTIAAIGCTMWATNTPTWYNIIFAVLFSIASIVWILATIHIRTRLKQEKKKT